MSISTGQYDSFIAQCAYKDLETLESALEMQRGLVETLLAVAQYETDDPEKREILDEIEENAREFGLISSGEDECSCNCSCGSSSYSDFPTLNELVETNANDAADADDLEADEDEPELDADAPGKILNAAAAEAANDTDGEPSSGSLAEYRERQANANDADAQDDLPASGSLAEWRQTEDGKDTKRKHLSFAELLRGGRNE